VGFYANNVEYSGSNLILTDKNFTVYWLEKNSSTCMVLDSVPITATIIKKKKKIKISVSIMKNQAPEHENRANCQNCVY
jgi:hypothetical protein